MSLGPSVCLFYYLWSGNCPPACYCTDSPPTLLFFFIIEWVILSTKDTINQVKDVVNRSIIIPLTSIKPSIDTSNYLVWFKLITNANESALICSSSLFAYIKNQTILSLVHVHNMWVLDPNGNTLILEVPSNSGHTLQIAPINLNLPCGQLKIFWGFNISLDLTSRR